ncbi:MAG: fused MFS/spermidine synthase [Candidatus Methanomethyliaceae archaeon]
MSLSQRRYLYFAVFASGMTTLAVELSASRLLGNIFGTSNLVWASIIGLILIYLTAGYFIGGRWADRSPHLRTMYTALLWGAFLSGMVPLPAAPVLRFAADAFDQLQVGILFGSFTAVLVLFSVPVTILGTISPFAIRLAIRQPEEAGTIAGRIYAISTLGSFIGTFLPVLVMIPAIGTTRTFLVFGAFLCLVALVGLWTSGGWRAALPWVWMPLVLIALAGWGAGKGIKATAGQIYETESAYNYIQVLEKDGYRYLRLNEGQGFHSIYHPTQLMYYGPWMEFLAAPFFNEPPYEPERVQRIAIIGLAAGTLARQATAAFGAVPIDGFEIDPKIIEVGRRYFDMNQPNLNAIATDGRWGLEKSPHRYTLIAVDAYRPPYIPWHLTTREFFAAARAHLEEDGVLAVNVGHTPDNRRLIDGLVGTIATSFPSIYVVDVPGSFNSLIYATAQPTRLEYLYANLLHLSQRADVHPILLESMKIAILNQVPTPTSDIVYTDDLAPIEWITNQMVLQFVLFGDKEVIHGLP